MNELGTYGDLGTTNLEQQIGTENKENISQADIQRIKEQSEKAKIVSQQIKNNKKTNHKFAEFLTFLLQNLNNKKIINQIYQVFFKTKNPKDNIKYLKKNINFLVIIGIFGPFYPKELHTYGLIKYYEKLYNFNDKIDITKYINYIKKLSQTYHDNIPIDKNDFLLFMVKLCQYYKIIPQNINNIENPKEKHTKLYSFLEKSLF